MNAFFYFIRMLKIVFNFFNGKVLHMAFLFNIYNIIILIFIILLFF